MGSFKLEKQKRHQGETCSYNYRFFSIIIKSYFHASHEYIYKIQSMNANIVII